MSLTKKEWAVSLFCIWHMVAVATYAMPDFSDQTKKLRALKSGSLVADFIELFTKDFYELTKPYTLLTSQWQKWTLFAPDPLRRVTSFAVEAEQDGKWHRVHEVQPRTVSFWNAAVQLKTIRRLEESKYRERNLPIRAHYAKQVCARYNLAPDTPVRLRIDHFVLPMHTYPHSVSWWKNWKPEWVSRIDATAQCPHTSL
ncbi:hypothetical protein COU78_01270 [Candidatus Peregrinibacteria bacterium CG10_big_fil_rev_8_21_14_0_10_49_24]|nr:MAG: hypothetical protein COV83_04235 [Candidatus Peregrinibacteria bacterium CG11_big_fil_rev_8_21_14_0_20_49_14]PIR51356.1 MAG: hypothetical protein COU78_01270 [Candidatus Peregrinibacteria bacterium CG10_big_fil_rev_8_21_14_0_10_49_24]PJA68120.1 MAG: hypothetical protein CO157_01085 [Candidatus Peregrinibacteria bacterium CG_4_9_14_3_um_filter_49_12]